MVLSQQLPSPASLKSAFPISQEQRRSIEGFRQEVSMLLTHTSRLMLLVGPCSIHHAGSMLSYANRLKTLRDKVSSTCLIVLRAYIEKPRTLRGWKGFLYQPDPLQASDLAQGLARTRKLFLELTDLGIPLGMEFVDPLSAYYFDDLITWGAIGARTSSSQTHRQIASYMPFPIGFKNTLDGNMDIPLQAMVTAASPQTFFGLSQEGHIASITSSGNPETHLILRGSETGTNYDVHSLMSVFEKQRLVYHISTPILLDCSHGNSKKKLSMQKAIFLEVLEQTQALNTPLLGMMLESFIKEGNQECLPQRPVDPELSITDPCLGWDSTEELVLWAHNRLLNKAHKTASYAAFY